MSSPQATRAFSAESLCPERQQQLASILEQYLADLEKGLRPDEKKILAEHPELAEALKPYFDGLDFLHQAAAEFGAAPKALSPETGSSEKQLGDYVILGEIGRGGMGIVYEARQISLDRRVALKVLPFAAVLDQRQITRFGNEARAAAQLHHPNIVPVFSVGCHRGVHYYAMQYIEGQSLDMAIRELRQSAATQDGADRTHRKAAGPPTATNKTHRKAAIPPTATDKRERSTQKTFSTIHSIKTADYHRAVAELAVQAADALQHAHDYGIIHRDIKPSNLLLDARGKLWVTDFGLARVQTEAGLSVTGDVLGTVRYMSPEQAAGQSSLVDHRTDVYSLGITLYELLTLQDAFDVADRQEFLRRIADEEPRPPRRINPAVPVDLETIVLKAIAKLPQQRYATAAEMAEDLRRFLRGEPLLARRPTLSDRAGKWARRHKTAVRAAAAMLLLTMAGLTVSTLLIAREHAETKTALAQSQTNLLHSEAHFRQARRVVDHFAARHAEQLATVPGAERLRREVLSDALGYYREFIALVGDDPDLQADLAVTHFKVGTISEQIGAGPDALAAYRSAEQIFRQLVARQPGVAAHRRNLALCWNNIGLLLARAGKTAEAEAAYTEAIGAQRQLADDVPAADAAEYRGDLAASYANLGLLAQETGRIDLADRSYRTAIKIQEEVARALPDRADCLGKLAVSYNNLGFLFSKTDPAEAERCYGRALAIQGELVKKHPDQSGYRSDRALCYNNLGVIQTHLGRFDEARESYRAAIAIQQPLVRKAPSVIQYRRDLSVSYNNLGRLESQSQQPAEASKSFEQAREILDELVRDYPDELSYRSSLGGILNNLGMVLEQLARPEAAADMYRQAIEHQKFALQSAPDAARFREFLGKHYANYSRVLRAMGRADEAAEAELAGAAFPTVNGKE